MLHVIRKISLYLQNIHCGTVSLVEEARSTLAHTRNEASRHLS